LTTTARYGVINFTPKSYLYTSATLIKEDRDWQDENFKKFVSLTSSPYWLIPEQGNPIPIHDEEALTGFLD
jgi:hypothetical protein